MSRFECIKCYTCAEKSSNCESNSITCRAGFDRCGKVTFEVGGNNAVTKACLSSFSCEHFATFCDALEKANPKMDDCKGTCCSGDNCNLSSKNSHVMIGIIVFGVLAAIMLK